MPETSVAQLTGPQRDAFLKAKDAVARQNHDYVIMLLPPILEAQPGFLEGRKLLRGSQFSKAKTASKMDKNMAAVRITPMVMQAKMAAGKSLGTGLAKLEEALALDPHSPQANAALAELALANDLTATAIFAHETIRSSKPQDTQNLHGLARALIAAKQMSKARDTYQTILQLSPTDGAALKGMKDASALVASEQGGWEKSEDYRDSLKDKEESLALESASKVIKSDVAIAEQLDRLHAQLEQEPQNVGLARQIAELCETQGSLDHALQWFQFAYELTQKTDPVLEKAVFRLRGVQLDLEMDQARAAGAEPAVLQEILSRKNSILLEGAKGRVSRYPNDLQYRFELGEALMDAGLYKEAATELQQALRQPSVRHRALNLLGVSYQKRRMLDLAAKQFALASSELVSMDAVKKDAIYSLGIILEEMGKKTEALDEFKKIYEVDSQFRDIAERVESAYHQTS
ncbi:MAG: tetratricopeptide repeat protein [Verrucomicrobia bacterium]|nr:tetratricopeptide repeat protein [Verrucomicrobiota bacterium]